MPDLSAPLSNSNGVEGEIGIFGNGESAILFIEHVDKGALGCPDLAIIDLNLPRKPGREVLAAIRSSQRCRDVPVLILSSSDAAEDRADAARFGASHYLRKPTRLEEFLNLGAIFREALGYLTPGEASDPPSCKM